MKKESIKDLAAALYEATDGLKGEKLKTVIDKFSELMFRNGFATKSELVIKEFTKIAKKKAGIVDIEISSARPLTQKALTEITNHFGGKVETTLKTDESLIGGIKIKTDDLILDGSIKKQLQLLKQSI